MWPPGIPPRALVSSMELKKGNYASSGMTGGGIGACLGTGQVGLVGLV